MEPDIVPFHSSSPPPLDDDDGEVEAEEDEFEDFGGFSAPEPPATFRQPSPTTKPATQQPNYSFNHPVEQSQPTSTVNLEPSRNQVDEEGQNCNAESSLHLTNGYSERSHNSEAHTASIVGACSAREETGFADFTVFTEQAAHPWCCGLSPVGNTERWDGRVGGTNDRLGEQVCDSGQEVILESEPKSNCRHKVRENVSTKVKHCERRDAAPSQDQHHPQEAALNFPSGEEELSTAGDDQRERRRSFNCPQTSELHEDGEAEETVPHTFSMYESASEDLASFCDDLSFEGASADDLEPNVSSLASHDGQTDWDRTDDEDEELENDSHSNSFVNSSMGFHHCNQHATQETCATSNLSQSGTNTEDRFADFADSSFRRHRDQEHVHQADDAGVLTLGNLPPSDSFADFCSAPTHGDGEGSWAEFKDQSAQSEGKTWPQFKEPVSSLQADGDTEEEPDGAGQDGGTRRNSCQGSLSCRVQQLLQVSFPQIEVPVVDGEEELLSLCALLQTQHLPESGEATPELSGAQRIQQEMLRPHEDVHTAVGLQFQWGGSHSNRILLRCLGVDTRNIVFMGTKKQPVTVPAFASGLGMLEPTKDSVLPAVCSPGHTVVTAQALAGPQDRPDPSTHSVQEELPSSQLGWSQRGLSSSQDGTSPRRTPHFWGRK